MTEMATIKATLLADVQRLLHQVQGEMLDLLQKDGELRDTEDIDYSRFIDLKRLSLVVRMAGHLDSGDSYIKLSREVDRVLSGKMKVIDPGEEFGREWQELKAQRQKA